MKTEGNDSIHATTKQSDDQSSYKFILKDGLTKREYFAGLALQGILATQKSKDIRFSLEDAYTIVAVKYADMLIKELNADQREE